MPETKEEIDMVARSHDWDLTGVHLYELSTIEEQIRGESESTFFHPSEVELSKTTDALIAEIKRVNPARVVFDSLSEMRMLAETALRYRRQILHLKQFFAGRDSTVLLLDDRTGGASELQVKSIAHGVISLECTTPCHGSSRRQLSVVKIRGSQYQEGHHDLILRKSGIEVFPRLVAGQHLPNLHEDKMSARAAACTRQHKRPSSPCKPAVQFECPRQTAAPVRNVTRRRAVRRFL